MFGAKTLDKTLGWLRRSLAHDLAPNMADSYTSAGGNSKPNIWCWIQDLWIRLYLFWCHLSIHVILNFNFCLFPPATAKTWCGSLHLFGSSERNRSLKLQCHYYPRKLLSSLKKMITFLPCVTLNCLNMLLPSKPLRHTMPDDDEEAQTQVEEAFHVFVGKKNQKFHIRHSNDFISLIMENGGFDQLSAKYCNRYKIIIITEMVISIFRTFE